MQEGGKEECMGEAAMATIWAPVFLSFTHSAIHTLSHCTSHSSIPFQFIASIHIWIKIAVSMQNNKFCVCWRWNKLFLENYRPFTCGKEYAIWNNFQFIQFIIASCTYYVYVSTWFTGITQKFNWRVWFQIHCCICQFFQTLIIYRV